MASAVFAFFLCVLVQSYGLQLLPMSGRKVKGEVKSELRAKIEIKEEHDIETISSSSVKTSRSQSGFSDFDEFAEHAVPRPFIGLAEDDQETYMEEDANEEEGEEEARGEAEEGNEIEDENVDAPAE